MTEHNYGPSGHGTVVLDLGPGTGALVLHAPRALDGAEIDISPSDRPDLRTHSMVRPRHTGGNTQYAAVYPGLAAGEYTVWHDHARAALTVTVTEATVTTASLPR
jgi:hypothetical protein